MLTSDDLHLFAFCPELYSNRKKISFNGKSSSIVKAGVKSIFKEGVDGALIPFHEAIDKWGEMLYNLIGFNANINRINNLQLQFRKVYRSIEKHLENINALVGYDINAPLELYEGSFLGKADILLLNSKNKELIPIFIVTNENMTNTKNIYKMFDIYTLNNYFTRYVIKNAIFINIYNFAISVFIRRINDKDYRNAEKMLKIALKDIHHMETWPHTHMCNKCPMKSKCKIWR